MKVGITGHQKLESYNNKWIKDELWRLIDAIQVNEGFTSLAIGADQLFAEVLLTHGMPFTAIIPCSEYAVTFETSSTLEQYNFF